MKHNKNPKPNSSKTLSEWQKDRKAWREMARRLLVEIRTITDKDKPLLNDEEKKMIEWFQDKAKSNKSEFNKLINDIKMGKSGLSY